MDRNSRQLEKPLEGRPPRWRGSLRHSSIGGGIARGWNGRATLPLILDELPYLVTASPEIPSVLQRWLDHDARRARLIAVFVGFSQRMMQGLVLAEDVREHVRLIAHLQEHRVG